MKKTIPSILLALLLISISCSSQKKSTGENTSVDYQIQSSYILIPVEEKAPEVKIQVITTGQNELPAYDVHLAQNHIDYWVPLDVKKLKGQKRSSNNFEQQKRGQRGSNVTLKGFHCPPQQILIGTVALPAPMVPATL